MPVLHEYVTIGGGTVKSWASEIDRGTVDQALRAAALPVVHGHVALMPDAHVGIGATIGSVIATKGAVIPAAVGVDLGCGVGAIRTDLTASDLPDNLGRLHGQIAAAIPAGVGKGHKGNTARQSSVAKAVADSHAARLWSAAQQSGFEMPDKARSAAQDQLGTLGSGNHFVEVCLDETDVVWLMLHSGSRGVGNQLAQMHIDRAKADMADRLEDPNLAYFIESDPKFDEYIAAMLWSQDYAAANRDVMLAAAMDAFTTFMGRPIGVQMTCNCHHNFCVKEVHAGHELWVTRKGAIRAAVGDLGVIPGSMGTRSYVVSGRGVEASYQSCSHGAGRRMSRNAARKTLDRDGLRAAMAGKTWNDRDADRLIDEDPRAYKDIDEVMANQADLVDVLHTLRQVLNYKGV